MNGRAELKVDGGKLLRADVAAEEEIEAVELHGDFFIYPEDALADIEAALEGASADVDVDAIARRVADATGEDVRTVGFGAEDVARVVAEAVADAE